MTIFTIFWIGLLATTGIALGLDGIAPFSDPDNGETREAFSPPKSAAATIAFLVTGVLLLGYLIVEALGAM